MYVIVMTILMVSILPGVWVCMNLLPTLLCITKTRQPVIGWRDYIGWGMWLMGFIMEVVADNQKISFSRNPVNKVSN